MSNLFADHKEPEELFLPLSARQYAEFYSIEMENFVQDIRFYQDHCKKNSRILELGCGTGRISQALSSSAYSVTGLDNSFHMLQQATKQIVNPPLYVCMDMTEMAFSVQFDHILIPYNTLNLLKELSAISSCLQQANTCLKLGGTLLLQLHIPDKQLLDLNGGKLFQFQTFSLPEHSKGKLIKETLRSYHSHEQEIRLEERYRVRPEGNIRGKEDLSHILRLAAFPVQQWIEILHTNGFNKLSLFGAYNSRPFLAGQDSMLLIEAQVS
ncbi:MAG: class I SAM-dependent methyltransferase [Thermodesulfobacteriota bacterium]|nr:class I SAM-dependent methyltransferase [Thermodesulfobacteriota bacterium]